jgi:hypothetical protein
VKAISALVASFLVGLPIVLLVWGGIIIAQELEPPPGWTCNTVENGATGDHICTCKHMADPETSCETPLEKRGCKVYCFKKHCACPMDFSYCDKPPSGGK